MFSTLALALVAITHADTDGQFVWAHGDDAIRRSAVGYLVDTDELWTWQLISAADETFDGELLYEPDSGFLYAQGVGAGASWTMAGLCADTGEQHECDVVAVGLSDASCQSFRTTILWQPEKGGVPKDLVVGGHSFSIAWDGAEASLVFFDVDLRASSHDEGEVDEAGSLYGYYDHDADTLHLAWWNDRLCDGFVVQQDAACTATGSGRVNCRGDADVWLSSRGATTSLSFWGYDNMTTVKGFRSTTLPHVDGMLIECGYIHETTQTMGGANDG